MASKWDSALYSHREPFLDPPEQFNLGVIDRWWVESQEQSHLDADPSMMLSERNHIRIAAQGSNLVEDHTKILKTLEEWCLMAFNPIVLYKPPYLHDQDCVKSYLGRATICPTMESMWPGLNPMLPSPPAVQIMPQTTGPFPDNSQHVDIRWTGMELEPNDSNDAHNVSAETIIFDNDASACPTIDNGNAGPSNKPLPAATASVATTAVTSDQMSQMQQLQPQCLQQQYSNSSYTAYTGSQWQDAMIDQLRGSTLVPTCQTGGISSQVSGSPPSPQGSMKAQDSLTQQASSISSSMLRKSTKNL